jgi:hypothetical protein
MLDMDYEYGLRRLKDSLPGNDFELNAKFNVLKARLLENLKDKNLYGSDQNNRAEHNKIMDALGRFTQELLGVHFIDLCRHDASQHTASPSKATSVPQSYSQGTDQSWIGGAEIVVEGKTYWLHDPIEEIWSPDRSVVQWRAKAQQSQTNRKVWLKQAQVLRSTSTANTLRNALWQEGRLLEELERERRRDFPRLLASHNTELSVTIVYDSTQGSPLTQSFGPKDTPLDALSAHALLQSMQSLCGALSILHRRHLAYRALTPETILLQDGRRAMLQDVGLATRTFELGEGPELYRAPEQIRPAQDRAVLGPYTDIYQLGVIFYHILTGHLPSSPPLLLEPSRLNNALPQELDAVLLRAINPEVKTRWHNIHEFSNALKQAMK